MTIKELRAKVVAELGRREAARNEMAGVSPGSSPAESNAAWDEFYEDASYEDFEAADAMDGEVEALRWVVDLIDANSRPSEAVRSSRPSRRRR